MKSDTRWNDAVLQNPNWTNTVLREILDSRNRLPIVTSSETIQSRFLVKLPEWNPRMKPPLSTLCKEVVQGDKLLPFDQTIRIKLPQITANKRLDDEWPPSRPPMIQILYGDRSTKLICIFVFSYSKLYSVYVLYVHEGYWILDIG